MNAQLRTNIEGEFGINPGEMSEGFLLRAEGFMDCYHFTKDLETVYLFYKDIRGRIKTITEGEKPMPNVIEIPKTEEEQLDEKRRYLESTCGFIASSRRVLEECKERARQITEKYHHLDYNIDRFDVPEKMLTEALGELEQLIEGEKFK
jgi:hypothetical protein